MSETENKTPTQEETIAEESATEKASCKSNDSKCASRTPLYFSIIALLLAAYAAATASTGNSGDIEKRLTGLDNQIANIDNQLVNLDKDVQSNRESLIQTKLKKAILNLQEIGNIAGAETKATITEVKGMLQALTAPVIAPEEAPVTEPEIPVTEPVVEAEPVEAAPEATTEEAPAAEAATEVVPETPTETAPATEVIPDIMQEAPQAF